jgi:hypothetical protein
MQATMYKVYEDQQALKEARKSVQMPYCLSGRVECVRYLISQSSQTVRYVKRVKKRDEISGSSQEAFETSSKVYDPESSDSEIILRQSKSWPSELLHPTFGTDNRPVSSAIVSSFQTLRVRISETMIRTSN